MEQRFTDWFLHLFKLDVYEEGLEEIENSEEVGIIERLVNAGQTKIDAANPTIYVVNVKSFEDAKLAIDYLQQDSSVVLNFSGMDQSNAQALMNYISGAAYAIGASLTSVSGVIFLAAPNKR